MIVLVILSGVFMKLNGLYEEGVDGELVIA